MTHITMNNECIVSEFCLFFVTVVSLLLPGTLRLFC